MCKIVGFRKSPAPEYEVIWVSTWRTEEKLNCPRMVNLYRKMANLESVLSEDELGQDPQDFQDGVQFIKGHFVDDQQVFHYLVEWEPTWVHEEDIDRPHLIRYYHKNAR